MKAKFIAYLILILVVILITTIVIVANTTFEKPQVVQQPELSEYERNRLTETPVEAVEPDEPTLYEDESDVTDFAEIEPEFPGGEEAMIKFIQQHVEYPELSREMGEQGTVYVQFVVHSDGSIQNVRVLKGVSKRLDREAMRVVKMMPDWSPGMQDGEPIRVRYQIPIKFSIQY